MTKVKELKIKKRPDIRASRQKQKQNRSRSKVCGVSDADVECVLDVSTSWRGSYPVMAIHNFWNDCSAFMIMTERYVFFLNLRLIGFSFWKKKN